MLMFNPDSPVQLSILLFGGVIQCEGKELVGVFKGGKQKGLDKYKNIKYEVKIEGLGLKPLDSWKTKKEGIYQTNEEVLKVLANKEGCLLSPQKGDLLSRFYAAKEISTLILNIRGVQKELSTYYISTKELIYPDGCIHGQYQSCKTGTGRKAHNNPNLGNQPKPPSNVTKHFVSRFNEIKSITLINKGPWIKTENGEISNPGDNPIVIYNKGILLCADYKSIDVRCEAELCQDKNYIQDTINEVDTHIKNLALAQKISYEEAVKLCETEEGKKLRSKIKGFTFSQQYLASIKTSAKASGLTEAEVSDILDARKKEYPELYKWHIKNNVEVEQYGYYSNMLGIRFYFKAYSTPEWKQRQGVYEQYSPNEISNYKTQGTAGCIVDIMIGKFWREKALYNRDKYLIINQVHDNLILDCKGEYKEQAKEDLKLLESWIEVCYDKFKYKWTVPIKVEISEGVSWFECF